MEWVVDFPKVKELGSVHGVSRSERGADFEWRIQGIKLEDIRDGQVESPQFSAFGLRWFLTLARINDSGNSVRIGIWRGAGPDPVRYWLAVRKADLGRVVVGRGTLRHGWNESYGRWMFYDELESVFPSFTPSGTLTVLARLRTGPETDDEMRSLYGRSESESSLEARAKAKE